MTTGQTISNAVFNKLKSIKKANGFKSDIGTNCYFGPIPSQQAVIPYINVYSRSDTEEKGGRNVKKHMRNYAIEAIIYADDDYIENQENILYDLRLALVELRQELSMEIESGEVTLDDPEVGSELAVVKMQASAIYCETYRRGA